MKRYKLLKDLPTFKAGDMFYMSQRGDLIHDGGDVGVKVYAWQTLEKFPNVLTDWFEKIQEEADSIHWKPKENDGYLFIDLAGDIEYEYWDNDSIDIWRYESGNIYRTRAEAECARNRRLAEFKLRRSSKFKPDLELGCGGYAVYYDHTLRGLRAHSLNTIDNGEIVRYETMEDAEKSIREHKKDWLTYFGVEDC